MDRVFIVNPAAGKGKSLKFIPMIKNYFENRGNNCRYVIKLTEYPGHAEEIARRYASAGSRLIYSVGGDGTLSEVVNGIAETNSILGVIPGGSGNDFIRSVTSDFDDILYRTLSGTVQKVDVGKVNGRYFINISSLGFDAQVTHTSNRLMKFPLIRGGMAYILGVFGTLMKSKSYVMNIEIDDERINGRYLLMAVANGIYYGGGMKAVPMAQIDDGYFNVCLIDRKNIVEILRFFPRFIKGNHIDIGGVSFYRCKKVEVSSEDFIALNIDGEVELIKKCVLENITGGVSMVMPVTK